MSVDNQEAAPDERVELTASHPLLSPVGQQQMDELCHTPARVGNHVGLLFSGAESYAKRWALLEKAEKTIHIVAFSLMRDQTSYQLRDLLLAKLAAGVEVKIILDDAVMWSTFSGNIVRRLRRAGAQVIRYHPLFRRHLLPKLSAGRPFKQCISIFKHKLKRRYHEKYLVVDGTEVILGGINWGNKYAFGGIKPKAWRDSDVYLSGPVVADIQRQFHIDFKRYADMEPLLLESLGNAVPVPASLPDIPEQAITGDDQVRYVAHKPYDDNELVMTNAYLQVIKQAQETIYWGCHGIRPPRVLAEALIEAAQRGVDVRLYTNSRDSSHTLMLIGLMGWMYMESNRHFYGLLQGGVRVFEWQKPGAFHSKNMVVDDVFASVGSYNIARGSTFHHTESNVFITGGDVPVKTRQQFERDEVDCKELALDEIDPPARSVDPYRRKLNARNRLVRKALLPQRVRAELYGE